MKKYLLLIYFVLSASICFGSCFGPKYTLTEILANQNDSHQIFTCKVIATYNGLGGYNSIAVVDHIYRGTPNDTIYIVSGGHTTAGGSRIAPKTEWLIISDSKDNVHYTATICHNLSRRIDNIPNICLSQSNAQGKAFLSIVKQYFSLEQSEFSGTQNLSIDNSIFARAIFKNGIPNGRWQHLWYSHVLNRQIVKSEIDYVNGKTDGYILKYQEHVEPRQLIYESYTKSGRVQYERKYQRRTDTYKYPDETTKESLTTIVNTIGDTVRISNAINIDYVNEKSNGLWFREGYYYNMLDSSSYNPLCEGVYHRGAKVGLWKFYNRHGEEIHSENYSYPDTSSSRTLIFDDEGRIQNEGKLINGRRTGRWKQYYDGILENELYYNLNSELELLVRHYRSGGKLISPYVNGKIEGVQVEIGSNTQVRTYCTFRKGVKDGVSIKFDKEGEIESESNYKNGRETTIFSKLTNAPKVNGFSHGYNVQYSLRDGHKMYEGEINMGYNVGKHIEYNLDGSYTITYFPNNVEIIMNPCNNEMQIRREFYNSQGNLISIEE